MKITDASVFERHLDLTPLGGRTRGRVRCIFHSDPKPSLSLDLDRGLFNCFGCGEYGGTRRFAELVGEAPQYRPPHSRPVTEYEMAVHNVLRREREAVARRAEWLPFWLANDYIRECWKAVAEARRWAQVLGPDNARTWCVLELAARVETEARAIESQLGEILEEGRIG